MKFGKHTELKQARENRIGVMDVVLLFVGISLVLFTVAMIRVFRECGAVPDTLVTCVFAVLGGECGVMGWIKTTKDRNREHKWELEDRKSAQMDMYEKQKPP